MNEKMLAIKFNMDVFARVADRIEAKLNNGEITKRPDIVRKNVIKRRAIIAYYKEKYPNLWA